MIMNVLDLHSGIFAGTCPKNLAHLFTRQPTTEFFHNVEKYLRA